MTTTTTSLSNGGSIKGCSSSSGLVTGGAATNGPGSGQQQQQQQQQSDFESFYHSVCSELQNAGEVHSMSKLFSQLATDEERLRFVLERNFGKNLWWRDFNFLHKDRGESQRLRNMGNQVRYTIN